jgi:hypothetical protein
MENSVLSKRTAERLAGSSPVSRTIRGMTFTEYHRQYYYIRRQRLLDYLGGKCVRCGTTENLHFDHIDPSKKSFDIGKNVTLNDAVKAELDKCQLLCEAHHYEKTGEENRTDTHGTIYRWMKKKCRCDVCNEARIKWNAERKETRTDYKSKTKRETYGRPSDHGEVLHYRRGCKCPLCKKANSEYAKTLRSK